MVDAPKSDEKMQVMVAKSVCNPSSLRGSGRANNVAGLKLYLLGPLNQLPPEVKTAGDTPTFKINYYENSMRPGNK